jgi:hypothetical protein
MLSVLLNGRELARLQMGATWQEYRVVIPPGERPAPDRLELRFSYARRPAEAQPEAYAIGGTGVIAPVLLEAHSSRDLAYITVGTSDGSRHASGLNVAVFAIRGGALLASEAFSWNDGPRLADYLQGLSRGRGIVVAAGGGVPPAVDPLVCTAFSAFGAATCPQPGAGGYALIGVKGAAPGSALESGGDDAYLRLAPDRRSLSAAVDWLRFERLP